MPLLRTVVGAMIAFGLDRLSKILVIDWLDLPSVRVIDVQPPYLVLQMAWNKGINFGLFGDLGDRWGLIVVALVASLALATWVRNERGWLRPLAAGSIIGGALGNAFDRVIYGAVADYLNTSCCGIRNPYSFNVADVFIFGGAFLLIVGGRRR